MCGGVTAQQLQSHGQLEPIWTATAKVLRLCTKVQSPVAFPELRALSEWCILHQCASELWMQSMM